MLIILFFFFILISFQQKNDVVWFLKWMSFLITVMIIEHFVIFFFFGGNVGKIGRSVFRFINATETLLVAFLLIFLFLVYLNHQMKISKLWINLILFLLLSIIVIVQIRSVWLATAGGLVAVYIFSKKKAPRIFISIGMAIFLMFTLAPFINQLCWTKYF